jgi:hypothetical protein
VDWIKSSEIVSIISYLLPGFLAAWIFYGLTAHPRREPFERVIQALIFTAAIELLTNAVRLSLRGIGQARPDWIVGDWSLDVARLWSGGNAIILGVTFSVLANRDWLHTLLRGMGITKRTSYPSEWFSAFNGDRRYIILHLEGDRRLHGWPKEWPDGSDAGHFVLCDAGWLLDDNDLVPLHTVEHLVIPATSVKMVERLKDSQEITASAEQLRTAERALVSLQTQDENNGKQSTGPVPQAGQPQGVNGQATTVTSPAKATAPSTTTAPQKLNRKARKRNRK